MRIVTRRPGGGQHDFLSECRQCGGRLLRVSSGAVCENGCGRIIPEGRGPLIVQANVKNFIPLPKGY
jgi:hypothetical protein